MLTAPPTAHAAGSTVCAMSEIVSSELTSTVIDRVQNSTVFAVPQPAAAAAVTERRHSNTSDYGEVPGINLTS